MGQTYKCAICGVEGIYGRIFPWHLSFHNITPQDYYDQYMNPTASKNCHCGIPLKFKKLSRGYGTVCSKKCACKKLLNTMIRNNPNHQAQAGKKGGRQAAGRGITKVRKNNPDFFKNEMPKIGAKALKTLWEFRIQHNGMTPHEWLLWEHPEFKKLNPIAQDARFLARRTSGEGAGMKGCVMDFSLPEYKVCIELDGDTHRNKKGRLKDEYRLNLLTEHEWTILRFTNKEVEQDLEKVISKIKEILV